MTERIAARAWAIINRYSVEANYKTVYHSWWFHLWGLLEKNACVPLPTGEKRRLLDLEFIEAIDSRHFREILIREMLISDLYDELVIDSPCQR